MTSERSVSSNTHGTRNTARAMRCELGRSGLQVSQLCLGGNVFGWTVDRRTTFDLLDAWLDGGMNFVDTADSYSRWAAGNVGGESEQLIGDWLVASGKRRQVVLATKVGSDMGHGRKGLSPAYIVRAVDASLHRLRTDYIDLYQAHWDDPDTLLLDTLDAFARLIDAGKIRAIGASNLTSQRFDESLRVSAALQLPRYQSMQPHYNLCERGTYEGELQRICVHNGIAVMPYYSLASGFLTGKYRNHCDVARSARGANAARYLDATGRAILAALDAIAAENHATPAQVALAWLAARPGVTAPIASATTLQQLEEMLGSVRLELTRWELDELDRASAPAPQHLLGKD